MSDERQAAIQQEIARRGVRVPCVYCVPEYGPSPPLSDWCLSCLLRAASPQVTPSLDVEAMRANLHATFNGGHHEPETIRAFHHGMDTVCNVLASHQKGEGTNGSLPALAPPPAVPDEREARLRAAAPEMYEFLRGADERNFICHDDMMAISRLLRRINGGESV